MVCTAEYDGRELTVARTIRDRVSAEVEIKRSRFVAVVDRAETEVQAREIIRGTRSAGPGARHYCSAFILGDNRQVERSNDDGEPSGTAGAPMLEVLRGRDLTNVVAVVTRYFGGIKLGTGGLARAYADAVGAALGGARLLQREKREILRVEFDLADVGRIESELRHRGIVIVSVEYATRAAVTLAAKDPDSVDGLLASLTAGIAAPERMGSVFVEVPART